MYSVWLENSQIEMPIPASMATGPAQFACRLSNSSVSSGFFRSSRSQRYTASHGAIQYAMISRKFSYLVPALLSPLQARKNPMVPNPRATIARRIESGSLMPIAVNDSAPE